MPHSRGVRQEAAIDSIPNFTHLPTASHIEYFDEQVGKSRPSQSTGKLHGDTHNSEPLYDACNFKTSFLLQIYRDPVRESTHLNSKFLKQKNKQKKLKH